MRKVFGAPRQISNEINFVKMTKCGEPIYDCCSKRRSYRNAIIGLRFRAISEESASSAPPSRFGKAATLTGEGDRPRLYPMQTIQPGKRRPSCRCRAGRKVRQI